MSATLIRRARWFPGDPFPPGEEVAGPAPCSKCGAYLRMYRLGLGFVWRESRATAHECRPESRLPRLPYQGDGRSHRRGERAA